MKSYVNSVARILLPVIALSPYIFGFTLNPADSSSVFRFALGKGYYTHESFDCSSQPKRIQESVFEEMTIAFDHHVARSHVSAKVGLVRTAEDITTFTQTTNGETTPVKAKEEKFTLYFTPEISVGWEYFGFSLGPIMSTRGLPPTGRRIPFSAEIRIGSLSGTYFTTSAANNFPLLTGGGIFDFGLGHNLGEVRSNVWLGLAFSPYSTRMFSLKGEFPVSDKLVLCIRGQLPLDKKLLNGRERTATGFEYGLSIGGKIVL